MSRSPLGRIAGTTAIFLGLILAPTTAATADTTPAGLSPEQATAMQSAFGLSEAGVTDLLRAQEEAAVLESGLREELGADFGGAVFDIESQELTVQVLDASALDSVHGAGARAELVQHGQTGLDEAVEALNSTEDSASDSVRGWYADPESDAVVVEVSPGRAADAEQLVESAGVDPAAVVIEETTDQPRTYADIVGGNPYYFQQADGRWYVCSVGFGVVGGYVTAGHCGEQGSSTWLNAPGTVQTGTVAASVFPGQDSAWVRTGAGYTPRPLVDDYSGGTVAVTGSAEAPVGAAVCRSGQTTGWHCGVIQAKNQTVNYSGDIVNGLTRTSACAEGGDSGGSWLAGTQAQGVTSGGSGNCTSGGVTYYQPLNPILSQWGLTLLTS
ncbi:S1 family peptidase [Nocardiopsis metallicus]|uniref:Streptogrisin C n=1 Tax=Nocardiopsis metallicus TaxID=179819 RepID=A0A840WN52_9ACTN|nr:S1 family peptidase [Nocardiopsis metallicus]MBB5493057.1 streptogrisin C [Nocardiopsis metallicus]